MAKTTHASKIVANDASTAENPKGVSAKPLSLRAKPRSASAIIGQAKAFAFV
jgi:hypothetical protein